MTRRHGHWEQEERRLGMSLAAWGIGSTFLGAAVRWRGGSDGAQAFGRQTAAWGLVDLGIAALAHVRASRRDRAMDDGDRARLHRLLVVNAVLDAGYVAAGAAVWARADSVAHRWPGARAYSAESLRGDGAAVVVQGGFLFLLDTIFAARTSAHR